MRSVRKALVSRGLEAKRRWRPVGLSDGKCRIDFADIGKRLRR